MHTPKPVNQSDPLSFQHVLTSNFSHSLTSSLFNLFTSLSELSPFHRSNRTTPGPDVSPSRRRSLWRRLPFTTDNSNLSFLPSLSSHDPKLESILVPPAPDHMTSFSNRLKFTFRRPLQLLAIVAFAVLLALWLFYYLAPWGYVLSPWNYIARPHISQEYFNHAPQFDSPPITSAFSEEACERKYDQAWSVMNDNGTREATMDFAQIAYFVQVGNESIALLPRLLARLHHPRHFYIIHLDAKLSASQLNSVRSLVRSTARYSRNVHILKSEMVTYRAVSMVTNTIAAMTLAMEKHMTWDYFINISGADYPLISPEDQGRLLARPRVPLGRLNYVTFFPRNEWKAYRFRIREMHWDPAAVGVQNKESVPGQIAEEQVQPLERYRAFEYAKAEAWMILSRPFVQFVLRSGFAKRMLMNHMHSLSVPEHYFIDILYNHPVWKKTIVPDSFRQVLWYLKVGGVLSIPVGQHPLFVDKGKELFSLWEYLETSTGLFARKFSVANSGLMERIDAELSGLGLKLNNPKVKEFHSRRRQFFRNIVDHFDEVTKKTLGLQGYQYPESAYPLF